MRLPGGISGLDGLWQVLNAGENVITSVPADRFDPARFLDEDPAREGKTYTVAGGFLEDITAFDADYFGISPKEASRIDPQQRLLLECAVEALDDAQIDAAALAGGDTAVAVGASHRDYFELQLRRLRTWNAYNMSGSAFCNNANRLSYVLDLHGPSFTVDSACSSALTAVHYACEAIRTGRSALALAGGAHVMLDPADFVGFSKASMLSPTGRCHPFSALADGYVRGEGAGVFVLKPLRTALADGDRIGAVIVTSGVNDDGRTSGLSLPSATAQQELLDSLYTEAGIAPDRVAYVEAHGTGTPAGDPLECLALGRALGRRSQPLPIGSVKSTLGHLEAAAGVAGLLKAMLVLRHRTIPATLDVLPLSDEIDFTGLNLEPVAVPRPLLLAEDGVVGVNSFGFGGANAHVTLTASPEQAPAEPVAGECAELPLLVSGRTEEATTEAARRLADHLETSPDSFYDIAYTSCVRRTRHEHRAVVLAPDPVRAAAGLRALAEDGEPAAGTARGSAGQDGSGVGFVFCGNGSQWPGMGRDLLDSDDAFLTEVTLVDGELFPRLGWSVLDALRRPAHEPELRRTEIAQPLLFAVQGGLVASLAAAGITPAGVTGHSVGDVAAAYCAGALDRATACRIIAERSSAQGRTAGSGRMAAVGLGAADAEDVLAPYAGRLVVAGVNSSDAVTVSGEAKALAELGETLSAREVFFRELAIDYAYHSPAMEPVREILLDSLRGVVARPCRVPMMSSVTGGPVEGPEVDAEFWWRSIRDPVRFADALDALLESGCTVLVEIGPHTVLGPYLRDAANRQPGPVTVLPTLLRGQAGLPLVRSTVAAVMAAGGRTDWNPYFPVRGRTVPLPAYPWQRERHWSGEPTWWDESVHHDTPAVPEHPLLGERLPTLDPAWHQHLEPGPLAWLADHKVGAAVVLPAAAYADIALAAGENALDAGAEVTGLSIASALTLPFDDPAMDIRVQTTITPGGRCTIAGRSGPSGVWQEHARCRIQRRTLPQPPPLDLATVRARTPRRRTADEHYAECARAQLPYGPAFRTLTALAAGEGEVLADYTATVPLSDRYPAHPTLLDGALQAGMPLLSAEDDDLVPYLPVGIDTVRSWQRLPDSGHIHIMSRPADGADRIWDLTITDADGHIALQALGCRLRRFDAARHSAPSLVTEVMRAAPLPGTPAAPSPLPSPHITLAAAREQMAELGDEHLEDYLHFRAAVLDIAAHSTTRALKQILGRADTVTVPAVIATGVHPKHTRWLTALCRLAATRGALRRTGRGTWRITTDPVPERVFQEALADHPSIGTALHPTAVGGLHIADLLQGRLDPLEFLFSADNLAGRVYDHVPNVRYQYALARSLLRTALDGWPASRPLRVLEVGAGTGGLTAAILPVFAPERTHFTCTDISPAFFPRCRERFAAYDFIDYQRLDLDHDPTDQGFAPAGFDIVLAANALHAARDLNRTLRHISTLLADHGHLLAVESHNNDTLVPLFGMLDSYWEAEDTDLRPHGPLLAWQDWGPLLENCGFDPPAQIGDVHAPDLRDFSLLLAARTPRTATAAPGRPPSQQPDSPADRRWIVAATGRADGPNTALAHALADTLRTTFPGGADLIESAGDPDAWTAAIPPGPGPVGLVLIAGDEHDGATEDHTTPNALTEETIRQLTAVRALAVVCPAQPLRRADRPLAHHPRHRQLRPGPASRWCGLGRPLGRRTQPGRRTRHRSPPHRPHLPCGATRRGRARAADRGTPPPHRRGRSASHRRGTLRPPRPAPLGPHPTERPRHRVLHSGRHRPRTALRTALDGHPPARPAAGTCSRRRGGGGPELPGRHDRDRDGAPASRVPGRHDCSARHGLRGHHSVRRRRRHHPGAGRPDRRHRDRLHRLPHPDARRPAHPRPRHPAQHRSRHPAHGLPDRGTQPRPPRPPEPRRNPARPRGRRRRGPGSDPVRPAGRCHRHRHRGHTGETRSAPPARRRTRPGLPKPRLRRPDQGADRRRRHRCRPQLPCRRSPLPQRRNPQTVRAVRGAGET
ncbi:hypothetical protein SYYSPA8_12540 [Streptomyces yaizuensis]|uniref:Polyketide synthase n=1 Tax=Streptomyces yaizuensis TaxID=2989713 RepID=A0ABQ5NXQ0_9ACTN|nr:hypothetical protein SYYSPA8_12540 [Streptomyces sp. YSPA8]